MTQSNSFRKIFIDSRWRNSGGHNDFSIELPSDVDTTRTASVYLGSCSFSNTFETILSNVNDWLYFVSKDSAHVPSVVASNNKVYVLANSGFPWIWIPPSARLALFSRVGSNSFQITPLNAKLYFMFSNPLQANSYILYAKTVALGTYTAAQLAAQIQTALQATISGLSVTWSGTAFAFAFPNANWWVPNALDLDAAVTRFSPTYADSGAILPQDKNNTLNAILQMSRLTASSPFAQSATSGVIGLQYSYQLTVTALPTGQWTLAQFATILRTAADPQGTLGTTVTVNSLNYVVQWTANGSATQLYLPPAGEIDSLLTSTGASISGDYTRGTSSQLFNASWGLLTGGFTWAATIPQPNPRSLWPYVLTLPSASNIFLADLAASLQIALRDIIVFTTVTVAGSVITINTGDDAKTFQFPTYQELTNATWKRANWPSDIVDYATDPQAYNELMPLPSPSAAARVTTLGAFPPYTQTNVIPLSSQQYNTGAELAAALQIGIRTVNPDATVTFYSNLGTLVFYSPPPWTLQFPTDRELRDGTWRAGYWDPYPTSWIGGYDLSDPHSLNSQLYFPSPSVFKEYTVTGNIDMIPYREVYLSSSLTNFRTLQTGLGAQDILARIPIDVNYGEVVTFRAFNHDAISASDQHFRVMRFRFTDYAGRLVPIDQPVVIELVFLDSDPYAM